MASSAGDNQLDRLSYGDLPGWADEDHGAALRALCLSHQVPAPKTGLLGIDGDRIARLRHQACAISRLADPVAARRFFERSFTPHRIVDAGGAIKKGFVTGYFEPELAGSLTPSDRFCYPLYARPDDLVRIKDIAAEIPRSGLDEGTEWARRTEAGLTAYFDRAAIEAGALAGRGLELVYIEDPVDGFFVHIQGSARIRLVDGSVKRLTFAAKSGHPYSAIGRVLVERGALSLEAATMAGIKTWLKAHPEAAVDVMASNRSFIFFREVPGLDPENGPVGAAGIPLTPGRSLAVDRHLHTFGTPVWIDGTVPADGEGSVARLRRLMIAEDTGSAIVGPTRGDLFIGFGDAAGAIAGAVRHGVGFYLLVPNGSDAPKVREADDAG